MSVFVANCEWIWIAWGFSGFFSTWATMRAFRRVRAPRLARLVQDDQGVAYTLSYVMTVPLYLIMVLFFVELSLILIAKIGTVYSAFAAARAAIVWSSAASEDVANEKSRTAAIQAMAPFASGLTQLRMDAAGWPDAATGQEARFMAAYDDFSGGQSRASRRYVAAKYRYAAKAVEVSIAIEPKGGEKWNEDVQATVTYDYPYIFPVLGRILMLPKKDGRFVRPITSTVRLQNETPKNTEKRLGISYASP